MFSEQVGNFFMFKLDSLRKWRFSIFICDINIGISFNEQPNCFSFTC